MTVVYMRPSDPCETKSDRSEPSADSPSKPSPDGRGSPEPTSSPSNSGRATRPSRRSPGSPKPLGVETWVLIGPAIDGPADPKTPPAAPVGTGVRRARRPGGPRPRSVGAAAAVGGWGPSRRAETRPAFIVKRVHDALWDYWTGRELPAPQWSRDATLACRFTDHRDASTVARAVGGFVQVVKA